MRHRLIASGIAAAGIALLGAPTAAADEQDFITAIESLGHYATTAPGTAQEALAIGYRACAAFDRGGDAAAIQTVLDAYSGDTSQSRNYHATLFAQQAAYNLCPEHNGEIGQI